MILLDLVETTTSTTLSSIQQFRPCLRDFDLHWETLIFTERLQSLLRPFNLGPIQITEVTTSHDNYLHINMTIGYSIIRQLTTTSIRELRSSLRDFDLHWETLIFTGRLQSSLRDFYLHWETLIFTYKLWSWPNITSWSDNNIRQLPTTSTWQLVTTSYYNWLQHQ